MGSIIKKILCFFCYYSGMEWLIRKIAPINKVTIIMFHAVGKNIILDNLPKEYNFYIDKKNFEKKIRFFKRYNIVSFSDFANFHERKTDSA